MKARHILLAAVALAAGGAFAAPPAVDPALHAQALETLKRSVAFRTVAGGGQTPAYAAYLKDVLLSSGYAANEITIEELEGSAILIARYPGRDASKKPVVVLGHMDVVEAKPEDWERDPFTPVVENGYVYGRGAADNKFDVSMAVTALTKLRRAGWQPGRDVILALSGDEETRMVTTAVLAKRLSNAKLVINVDGGGGLIRDGKAVSYGIQGAEKSYADFDLVATDPGGHSSRPTPGNPIYRMARAMVRTSEYRFPVMSNEITRGSFAASAGEYPGAMGAAMARFAEDPSDQAAIATLETELSNVGMLRTTCVATLQGGGHAPNALPQRATAVVNCRIFPGTPAESVRQTLVSVINDSAVSVTRRNDGALDSPASPLRPDVMAAVQRSVHALHPGIPISPSMSAGATDSMYFRAAGVPSYGLSGMFSQKGESYAHGLNEKSPVAAIDGALAHYDSILRDLAK